MTVAVFDANIAVRWLLAEQATRAADRLFFRASFGLDRAVVPPHFHAEVYSGVYRQWYRGRLSRDYVRWALGRIPGLPVEVMDHSSLYVEALNLGEKHRIHDQTYDLVYLALADLLGVEFWSYDATLYRLLNPPPPWFKLLAPDA